MKKHQRKQVRYDSPLPACLASCPLIAPLPHIYGALVKARNYAYDSLPALSRKLDRPVISVGGIRAGGTGKTPAAQLVARHIIKNCGYGVAFLSRGYGRASKRPVIVRPNETADWRDTGDEPWMLHSNIPESWLGISTDRAAMAEKLSPLLPKKTVFILDDGFQHRRVRPDLNIVCLSESTFDDRMMPSGYLREPLSALSRADVVLVVGAEERIDKLREVKEAVERRFAAVRGNAATINTNAGDVNTAAADITGAAGGQTVEKTPLCAILLQYPDVWAEARSGKICGEPPFKDPVAVTGIARPDRFLTMLRSLSVEPSEIRVFRDHYNFKRKDLASVHNIYLEKVVTTEKDAVRLLSSQFADLREIWYLKIGLRFADPGSETLVMSKVSDVCRIGAACVCPDNRS
jgi:tetraacyldisaccharide 4'-kinase